MIPTTIWQQLNQLYDKSRRNFGEDLLWHASHGYIRYGPTHFIMGSDCSGRGWLIWVAVGDISQFIAEMPYYLPYVGWSRDPSGFGEIRWFRTEDVIRRL